MHNPSKHHMPECISQEHLDLFKNVVLHNSGSDLDKTLANIFEHADVSDFNRYIEEFSSKEEARYLRLLTDTCNLVLQAQDNAYNDLKAILDSKSGSGPYNNYCKALFGKFSATSQRLLQYTTSYPDAGGPEKRVSYNLKDFASMTCNARAVMRISFLWSMPHVMKPDDSQDKTAALVNVFSTTYHRFIVAAWLCYRDGHEHFDLPELSAEHKQLISMVPNLGCSWLPSEITDRPEMITYGSGHHHAGEHLPPASEGSSVHRHDEPEQSNHEE